MARDAGGTLNQEGALQSIDEIWADDLLDRRKDAEFLATILRKRSEEFVAACREKSFVLNIDSGWGRGKTFFLKHLQKHLQSQGHIAVYVNSWEDDFADDPLIAVISAIDVELEAFIPKKSVLATTWDKVQKSAGPIALQIGRGLALRGLSMLLTEGVAKGVEAAALDLLKTKTSGEETGKAVSEEALSAMSTDPAEHGNVAVKDFVRAKQEIRDFRQNLMAVLAQIEVETEKPTPMFVLVDELDRCRPAYAIATLERIKHLFNISAVVFVIATDSQQLQYAIGAIYGERFEGQRYLKRFFDSTFVLERPSIGAFVEALFEDEPIEMTMLSAPYEIESLAYIKDFYKYIDAELRAIEQMWATLRAICETWSSPVHIELAVMLPVIWIGYRNIHSLSDSSTLDTLLSLPTLPGWTTPFMEVSTTDGSRTRKLENLATLPQRMWRDGNGNLFDKIKNGSSDWISDRLSREHRSRFNNVIHNEPQKSLISTYPQLVRQAGRFRGGVENQ